MVLTQDIPRIYTGLAEWSGCLVMLLICPRRQGTFRFMIASAVSLVLQCSLLVMTAGVPAGFSWVLLMLLAIFLMFFYIYFCADIPLRGVLYCTASAFLFAEFAASLEWQLQTWSYKTVTDSRLFSFIILAAVYSVIFFIFFRSFRPHITDEYIKSLSWKEVVSVLLVALFTFVFSNLSFLHAGSPFSGQVAEDIFAIRTLADGIGIAILLGFQSRISELLAQRELFSIRHVLDSQYEQFRNYQESEEMLHMLQHDLKHQVEGLRGETNEQKKEAWLDMMENELDKWWVPQSTGNAVLDTILSASLRKARQLDVRITCVADGSLLNMLHVAEICTIFGNALDNAMESVVMIPEPDKRLIHISVSSRKNFVFISISNTLGIAPVESGGSLLTTKSDKKNHGYGIKGIRYVVGKHDGNVTYKFEDGWFRLSILIPM